MDPLTHGLLGAAYGQARHGAALGRRALVWGAVLAMAPDVDVVLNFTGPFGEWRWHRGVTHSLFFVVLAGAYVAAGAGPRQLPVVAAAPAETASRPEAP